MIIKKYDDFITKDQLITYSDYLKLELDRHVESISGTELIGPMGPGYGEPKSPNTINFHDTNVIFSDIDSKFYTIDEYNNLYQNHLKKGGEILDGFNKENIDIILTHN